MCYSDNTHTSSSLLPPSFMQSTSSRSHLLRTRTNSTILFTSLSYSLQPQEPAHLCARDGDEGHELVHMAHGQPVRVELHRCLHLLGLQEVLHHLGHPSTTGPGGGWRSRQLFRRSPTVPVSPEGLQPLESSLNPGQHQQRDHRKASEPKWKEGDVCCCHGPCDRHGAHPAFSPRGRQWV